MPIDCLLIACGHDPCRAKAQGHPKKGHRARGGKPQKIIQSPDRLYKAPTDYRKPRQTIQRPKILDKTLKKNMQNQKY